MPRSVSYGARPSASLPRGWGLAAAAVCLSAASGVAQSAIAPDDVALLRPGDRVLVTVWRKPE